MKLSEYEANQKLSESVFYIPKHARQSKAEIAIALQKERKERREAIWLMIAMIFAGLCFYGVIYFMMSF